MSQIYKVIDGLRFKQRGAYFRKSHAREAADKFRSEGVLKARVIPIKGRDGIKRWRVFIHTEKEQATTIKKVKSHQPRGKYKKTSVDRRKEAVDFRLLQVSPNVIRWRSGKTETVPAATLKKLQKTYTWTTDF